MVPTGISTDVFSALSGMRLLACLIVAPRWGYDEPKILSYAISPFCPTSADGLHYASAAACSTPSESLKRYVREDKLSGAISSKPSAANAKERVHVTQQTLAVDARYHT